MKLLIVRHGDPDYDIDSLTEKGWKEVEYLSQKLSKLDVKLSMYPPWKSEGYCGSDFEKDGKNSHRV